MSPKSHLTFVQEAERKEKEKQESLVKGLDEAVKEREVQGRRTYAAEQEEALQVRREEIRFYCEPVCVCVICVCLHTAHMLVFIKHFQAGEFVG